MNDPSAANARVLVVDDQPPNVRLLEAILAPRGYDVRTASSGEEALAALDGEDVDLVLLDIVMPGMDGYEVCRVIRERPARRTCPSSWSPRAATSRRSRRSRPAPTTS